MHSLDEFAPANLDELERSSLRRRLVDTTRVTGIWVLREGRRLLSFCCNDYLNLTHHPAVKEAAIEALRRYGVGAGASRFVSGNHPLLSELEARLARLKETDAACVVGGGRGSNFVEQTKVPLQMGTLSKALGAYGGYLCASAAVVELIRNRARTVIYSTGLPRAMAAAAVAALEVIESEPDYAALPLAKAKAFASIAGLPEPASPIVPVLLGEPEAALKASTLLQEEGFLVVAIRPPTVPMGTARLRLTFTAQHPNREVERLAELVRKRILALAPANTTEAQ